MLGAVRRHWGSSGGVWDVLGAGRECGYSGAQRGIGGIGGLRGLGSIGGCHGV